MSNDKIVYSTHTPSEAEKIHASLTPQVAKHVPSTNPSAFAYMAAASKKKTDPWGGKKDMNGDSYEENNRKFQERQKGGK